MRCTARDSSTTAFAIQQSNAAINHLVHARSSRSLPEQKVRALTASVLFAYQCSIQRLYSQSDVHLKAAKSLITELETTNRFRAADRATLRRESQPVPYESLMSIVANLQIHSQALQSDNMNEVPTSLRDVDVNTAWRYYSAPAHTKSLELCQHGRGMPSRATPANLARAGRAFESLLTEMVADSLQSSAEVARLSLEGDQKLLATLVGREKPYTRAFRELSNAIGIFVVDTTIECSCFGPSPRHTAHKQQRKAIDALRLYHATCYPLFLDKPFNDSRFPELYHPLLQTHFSDSPTSGPKEALARHFSHALDVVESLLQDSSPRERPTSTIDFTPTLPTTMPLFVIANVSGVSLDLRRRVIALLRQYTRHEVLWDTSFVAALTELIMMQEDMAEETEDAAIATPLTNKVHSINVTHIEANAARVMLQTWDDWVSNDPGHEMTLTW
ncbi:MAG: hypothetical protein M1821_009441 [Bathelium mastoideum]|nr:MAG: hypothetical protein M1821_009441 [Bathelium mastoideum]